MPTWIRVSGWERPVSEPEQIEVLTPIPLAARGDAAIHPFWPYGITIAAGLVGIAVGVFFAAGTAALYPLPTGGKPIIAAPVVGIISYETMMLLAVVVTFLTAIVRIRRAQRMTVDRETRIDEGTMALSLRVIHQGQEADIRRILEDGRRPGYPPRFYSPLASR